MPSRNDVKAVTVYECIESFQPAVGPDGVVRPWVAGDPRSRVTEGHPFLKSHRKYFAPITAYPMGDQPVERATAAPGEVRSVQFPDHIRNAIQQEETENAQV